MKRILCLILSLGMFLGINASAFDDPYFLLNPKSVSVSCDSSSNYMFETKASQRLIAEFDINVSSAIAAAKPVIWVYGVVNGGSVSQIARLRIDPLDDGWTVRRWYIDGSGVSANNVFVGKLILDKTYHVQMEFDAVNKTYGYAVYDGDAVSVSETGLELEYTVDNPTIVDSIQYIKFTNNYTDGYVTNFSYSYDGTYVKEAPVVSYADGKVSAAATAYIDAYRDSAVSLQSPVLVLCLYDASGMFLEMKLVSQTMQAATNTAASTVQLSAEIESEFTAGMTAKAFVINGLAGRIPFFNAVQLTAE